MMFSSRFAGSGCVLAHSGIDEPDCALSFCSVSKNFAPSAAS
jgi:hypothetical protein